MSTESLVDVRQVSKVFCRNLRRSLWYGCQDVAGGLFGRPRQVTNLRPDEFWAVRDISFQIKRGERVALIGGNGAGKTTVLRMLSGIIRPSTGQMLLRGRVAGLIALGAGFNPVLTGLENIYVNAALLGLTRSEIDRKIDAIVEFAEIGEFLHSPVQNYSSGMIVRLGFAVAAHLNPDLMLLDEVLAVGDARFRHKCYARLRELAARGTSFILVTHSMTDVMRFATRAIVLAQGRAVYDGTAEGGVAAYQAVLADTPGKRPAPEPMVRLVDVRLGGDGREERNGFNTFENIWLEFTVVSDDRRFEQLEVRFVVESPVFGEIATLSSLSSTIRIAACENRHASRYAIKILDVPLLRGAYAIHAHFFDLRDRSFLGTQDNVALLKIVEGPKDAPYRHLLALKTSWFYRDCAGRDFVEAERTRRSLSQDFYHG